MRSDNVTKGVQQAPHRSLMNALGMTEEENNRPLIGYGNSNIFSIVFSQALLYMPGKKNEISGLMIMGLFGGTVFPLAMGLASDAIGQSGAVAVMTVGVLYLLYYTLKIKK